MARAQASLAGAARGESSSPRYPRGCAGPLGIEFGLAAGLYPVGGAPDRSVDVWFVKKQNISDIYEDFFFGLREVLTREILWTKGWLEV